MVAYDTRSPQMYSGFNSKKVQHLQRRGQYLLHYGGLRGRGLVALLEHVGAVTLKDSAGREFTAEKEKYATWWNSESKRDRYILNFLYFLDPVTE